MRRMSMRERILAVLRGRPLDRVPFVQYDGLAAPNDEIWSAVGRNNMGLLHWTAVHRVEHCDCRIETEEFERGGLRGIRSVMHTPVGSLTQEKLRQPTYDAPIVREPFVKEPGDYRVLAAYLGDAVVCDDVERFLRDDRDLGDDGIPLTAIGVTPYQQMWKWWTGIENLAFHLVDCPDLVHECMSLIAATQRRVFEIVRRAPVPFADFTDNITASMVGDKYFRRYCVPFYDELAGMLADRDVPVFVHMDGDLKPLWEAIGESGVGGIDSFSPPPDNDTSAGQAVAMWPRMRLFLNFPSSVHLAPPEKVYAKAMEILQEAGHTGRLQIQISENVPPGVWRSSYPQIVRAIADFGPPAG